MNFVLKLVAFAGLTFMLWFGFGVLIVGYSCFKHGDRGPYPEADWAGQWLLPICMGVSFLLVSLRKDRP